MPTSKRRPTERQLVALAKARAALVKKHTCTRCGWEDPARGLLKRSDERIVTILRDQVPYRVCLSCRLYYKWLDIRSGIEQQLSTLFAEHMPFYLIDTETTGKDPQRSQVVEIAIIDQDGVVVYHTLCKPDSPMPTTVSDITGITDEMLVDAPTFAQVWPSLLEHLTGNDRPIYAWNAEFDRQTILTTAKRFHLPVPEALQQKTRWHCAMTLYARWYGEWSNTHNTYRWQTLAWACEHLVILGIDGHHRATYDAINALAVLREIANRRGAPFPAEMPANRFY